MSENKNAVELHGCIVCAKIYNVLAVYSPDGKLVGCAVTSPGGRCIPDERHPLVTCETHTAEEVDAAYRRWQSRNKPEPGEDREEE